MPTLLTKMSPPKWRGIAIVAGQRREKLFPDGSTKSKRAAVEWEIETRKQMMAEAKAVTSTVMVSPSLMTWGNSYLDFVQSRQSKKTHKEKQSAFKRLLKHFKGITLVETLNLAQIEKYLSIQFKERSGYSANKERKNLTTAWYWGQKYMPGFPSGQNIFAQVDRFAETRQPRYVPPEEDFWSVYAEGDQQDKIMLLTFLNLAARRMEVFNLKWDDINFPNSTVNMWTSKRIGGNRECDVLPLTKNLKEVLLRWWEVRPIKSEFVFVNLDEYYFCRQYRGQPFTNRQHLLKRLCTKAGVKPFGFHSIRHLTASILYREGQPLAVVQAILRHKSPTTTNRYIQSLGLKQTADALESVMGGRGPGKILKLPQRAAEA